MCSKGSRRRKKKKEKDVESDTCNKSRHYFYGKLKN